PPASAGTPSAPAPSVARRPYVIVSGVTKSFRRGAAVTHALALVELTLDEGEFVAVGGPSGGGKATPLGVIAGPLPPGAGPVLLDGGAVTAPQTALGVVFQSPVLLEWRTVLDNVLVQVELRGLDPRAYRARALSLLERVGLAEFADRYPRELSGGMR